MSTQQQITAPESAQQYDDARALARAEARERAMARAQGRKAVAEIENPVAVRSSERLDGVEYGQGTVVSQTGLESDVAYVWANRTRKPRMLHRADLVGLLLAGQMTEALASAVDGEPVLAEDIALALVAGLDVDGIVHVAEALMGLADRTADAQG